VGSLGHSRTSIACGVLKAMLLGILFLHSMISKLWVSREYDESSLTMILAPGRECPAVWLSSDNEPHPGNVQPKYASDQLQQ